jgi:S1-C subfamily serine protease
MQEVPNVAIMVFTALLTIFLTPEYVGAQNTVRPLSPEFPLVEDIQQTNSESTSSIIENVSNSVVGIVSSFTAETTTGVNPEFDGSGFVYDREGKIVHIVTAQHVVSGLEEESFYAYFEDGSRYTAKVIGTDPIADIAVLQIVWNATRALEPVVIGNSSNLQVGEEVIAIGSPFLSTQSFVNLVTNGIISKVGVEILPPAEILAPPILNAIVTNAPVAEGNSGGPLLNSQGQVIGMVTAGVKGEQCCTYVVPSNTISRVVPALIETGEYIHPWIGLTAITLNADPVVRELVPENIQGAIVYDIVRDGPAHKAGLRGVAINEFRETEVGDIITAVDGQPISTSDEFNAAIDEHSVGDDVDLTLYRNGTIEHVLVTLESLLIL